MCSLVVKKEKNKNKKSPPEHYHVQRVQRPLLRLIINKPVTVDMNVHEIPEKLLCLVTLSPSWRGMTINLNNTGARVPEGGGVHLQLSDDAIINVADWHGEGGHGQSMRKSAVVCAAAEGSRFAMHTACGAGCRGE